MTAPTTPSLASPAPDVAGAVETAQQLLHSTFIDEPSRPRLSPDEKVAVNTLLAALSERDAEVERWISAYSIAHDQATANGARALAAEAALSEAQAIMKGDGEALMAVTQVAVRPIAAGEGVAIRQMQTLARARLSARTPTPQEGAE